MNKKLMRLAAGVLTVLALAALPAVASAGEITADCKEGATCEAFVFGLANALGNTAGETISCGSFTGKATLTNGSSTGTANLVFHDCRETVTFFKFSCNSVGQPSGTITTGNLTTHLLKLESSPITIGLSVTNLNVTFTCAGFSDKRVTGNVLGEITDPACGVFRKSHSVRFSTTAHGQQRWKQITTTGTLLDLTSNNDTAVGQYLTSSLSGEGPITYVANEAKLTC